MPHRRDWLRATALAAAGLALPARVLARLAPDPGSRRQPYLELALDCARWIAAAGRPTEHGVAWPADPRRPESVSLDFYNGTPGVVLFLAELAHATGDERWGGLAREGGRHLAAALERADRERLDAGLYTGLAGLATVLGRLHDVLPDPAWAAAEQRALTLIRNRARSVGTGVTWTGSHDIISGNAGTGLLLLRAQERTGDRGWLDLATRAGDRLLAVAEPARGGLMWLPGESGPRNYPNFSHGTAGVAYFLATLHERTAEARFLEGALAGVRYLDAIATRDANGVRIHHHDDGGEDLFYLSWCHGPPGTARLFHRLHRLTGDPSWAAWVHDLARATLASGIPENRTPGFWNNISQCCGNVGVGEYFLALSRLQGAGAAGAGLVDRVVRDTLQRAERDEDGLRWVQAEHRVQPANLVAQTGYMQGAAGVGTFLLRLDAHTRSAAGPSPLPDSPFAS